DLTGSKSIRLYQETIYQETISPKMVDVVELLEATQPRDNSRVTRKLTFIVVLFVSSVALASIVVAQAIISGDEIKKIVTFIFPPDDHGNLRRDLKNNPIPYGTGFFVAVKNDTGKGRGENS